jgi:hypothetical protein
MSARLLRTGQVAYPRQISIYTGEKSGVIMKASRANGNAGKRQDVTG